MQNNSETATRPTLHELRADLVGAGEEISKILTRLENKYQVALSVELEQITNFDGVSTVVASLSAEVRG